MVQAVESVRIFHEGLFWRCSYTAASTEYSLWDLWICKSCHFADLYANFDTHKKQHHKWLFFPSARQPPPKLCQAALLFPFPVNDPVRSLVEPRGLQTEVYEHNSAIGWYDFLL